MDAMAGIIAAAAASSQATERSKQKKCVFCDRTFSKPAHLKRHQRAHTGERPFKCSLCSKRFSRSDVLIRHTKNHPENVAGIEEEVSASSEYDPEDPDRRGSRNDDEVSAVKDHQSAEFQGLQLEGQVAASSAADSSTKHILTFPSLSEQHPQIPQSLPLNLDQRDAISTERVNPLRDMDTNMSINHSLSGAFPQNHDHMGLWDLNESDHRAPGYANEASTENMSHPISSNFSTDLGFFDSPSYVPINETVEMEEWIKFQTQNFLPSGNEYIQQDDSSMHALLQTWFNQTDDSSRSLQRDDIMFESTDKLNENRQNEQSIESEHIQLFPGPEDPSATDDIPKELFEKVQQCWPAPSSNMTCKMPTLWRDTIFKVEDNLFSNKQVAYKAYEKGRPRGSRWGLDKTLRERLQISLESQPTRSPNSPKSPEDKGSSPYTNEIVLPPADILDIGMDLYFRHFHPLVPFIHVSTFSLELTPAPMLLAMCLLGLASIKTKEAQSVIQNSFAKLLVHVHAEMFPSALTRKKDLEIMTTLATAFMLICLAGIAGDAEDRDQSQVLYVNTITVAQQNGLFDAKCGPMLEEDAFAQLSDFNVKWKAWARVESVKRLIICLIIIDSWFAGLSHSSPNIRIDTMCFIMPCDRRLFQAKTAAAWARLLESGHTITMPLVDVSSEETTFPKLSTASSAFGLHGILSAIRLRMSDAYHRLMSGRSKNGRQSLVPWETFATDVGARHTRSLLVDVMRYYGKMLHEVDPNCMMLWHNMNVMLCADLRIFELGAGRAGSLQARKSLSDIGTWSDTPAARRACVHAGQMYKLMSNRRASDGTMLHSAIGLFMSALVLGLYILKARPIMDNGSNDDVGFDLLDDVDWRLVKDEGYVRSNELTDDPVLNFIRNGGKIIFAGVEHDPGYTSARRILLDYAGLLEDCMKWNGGRFSPILRIMSDALVDA